LGEADEKQDQERDQEEEPQGEPGRQGEEDAGPALARQPVWPHETSTVVRISTAWRAFQQSQARPPTEKREPSSQGFSVCSVTTNRSAAASRTIHRVLAPW